LGFEVYQNALAVLARDREQDVVAHAPLPSRRDGWLFTEMCSGSEEGSYLRLIDFRGSGVRFRGQSSGFRVAQDLCLLEEDVLAEARLDLEGIVPDHRRDLVGEATGAVNHILGPDSLLGHLDAPARGLRV